MRRLSDCGCVDRLELIDESESTFSPFASACQERITRLKYFEPATRLLLGSAGLCRQWQVQHCLHLLTFGYVEGPAVVASVCECG
ncbi:hypothetical protein A4U94_15195 [Prescottella equi]|nr:hypothetical protein A4U94_15195 [Prescottella equi]